MKFFDIGINFQRYMSDDMLYDTCRMENPTAEQVKSALLESLKCILGYEITEEDIVVTQIDK